MLRQKMMEYGRKKRIKVVKGGKYLKKKN